MTEIVLFGVTGDLARQKLIPSLFSLYNKGVFRSDAHFFGFGRKPFSEREFAEFVESCVRGKGASSADIHFEETLGAFAGRWTYVTSELDDDEGYAELASKLMSDTAVIYISLPPALQMPVCRKLIDNKVVERASVHDALISSVMKSVSAPPPGRRIALEKPYGQDAASARDLEAYLSSALDQSQILRVDHYAGKQALVELEHASRQGVFKPLLDFKGIKKIELRMLEENDVSSRGAFYDSVGALNDTLQNHMLHMLASVLALPLVGPRTAPGDIAALRTKLLEGLKITGRPLLGQYAGYTGTQGVQEGSITETFYDVEAVLAYKGAAKIKIRFVGGKALKSSDSSITVSLRSGNMRIPMNGYGNKEAHEQIFEDAANGNLDRFISFGQAMAGWRIVGQVKKAASSAAKGKSDKQGGKPVIYKKGIDPSRI